MLERSIKLTAAVFMWSFC